MQSSSIGRPKISTKCFFLTCLTLILVGAFSSLAAQDPVEATEEQETALKIEAVLERIALDTHKRAVWNASKAIIAIRVQVPEIEEADPLLAEMSALLHDVGGGGAGNAAPGAEITERLLTDLEHEAEFVRVVARIVETHHVTNDFSEDDNTPEWKIVLVADSPALYPAFMSDEEFEAWMKRRRDQAFRYDFEELRTSEEAFVEAVRSELVILEKRVAEVLKEENTN
jgi:hypothetical protein